MAKVKTYEIDSKIKYKIISDFFDIVSGLNTKKEIIDFFIGLFTSSETLMMARRIQIAKLIIDGKNYDTIRHKLKVSYQTIQKTDSWLNSEDEKYNLWIKKQISKANNKEVESNYSQSMLDKYSHHKFLKNLFK